MACFRNRKREQKARWRFSKLVRNRKRSRKRISQFEKSYFRFLNFHTNQIDDHFYGLHVDLRACPWPKQLLPKNVWHKKKRFSHPNHRTDRFGCLCSQGTCNPFVNESWKFKTDRQKKRGKEKSEKYTVAYLIVSVNIYIFGLPAF